MTATKTPRRNKRPRKSGPKPPNAGEEVAKMFDVDQEIAEYEFRITGASGFEGGKDLKIDDVANILVGGKVVGDAVVVRRRHESGAGSEQEFLVRVVTLKATGAMIR